jgi:2-C-methyl-D-erythritol 4-phosphate cytidylyltransferase/2-C-methyl-D-erythritol 2,4-cyclodiphosphate synthase
MQSTAAHRKTSEGPESMNFHVIVAAAGRGTRFGGETPKQYQKIGQKTVLRHTLESIISWNGLSSVRVIIDPEHSDLYQDSVIGLDLPEPIHGGKERNNSINNALNKLSHLKNEDIILVHDAARPCASNADVAKLLAALTGDHRAATLGVAVSDTLRHAEAQDAGPIVNREGLWALQTPQAFFYGDLVKAHAQAKPGQAYTDDTALVSEAGIAVKIVPGSRANIKITTPEDLRIAEALLLSPAFETRTGFGYDVHAFETVANTGRRLMLGGLHIPHPYALAGHSDADVALHALTDALLGALGEGDIGLHFPPSDSRYKDMDSAHFLKSAAEMLARRDGSILNLDLTIICEMPKITPHREAMQRRIADIAGIDISRINVKATTTEKLGFTGRGEGIAAQAVATIKMPVQ